MPSCGDGAVKRNKLRVRVQHEEILHWLTTLKPLLVFQELTNIHSLKNKLTHFKNVLLTSEKKESMRILNKDVTQF